MAEKIQRKNYFIDKRYQSKFIMKFCLIVVAASMIVGFLLLQFSKDSTTVMIKNTKVYVKGTADFMLPLTAQTLIIVTIFSAISVIVLTLFTSHKIAGPLYGITKKINNLKEGDLATRFHIRKGDQLQPLADSLNDLSGQLSKKYSVMKEQVERLKGILQDTQNGSEERGVALQELEKTLDYFKV